MTVSTNAITNKFFIQNSIYVIVFVAIIERGGNNERIGIGFFPGIIVAQHCILDKLNSFRIYLIKMTLHFLRSLTNTHIFNILLHFHTFMKFITIIYVLYQIDVIFYSKKNKTRRF